MLPDVAVEILESMAVHEAVIHRGFVGRAARGHGLADNLIDPRPILARQTDSTSVLFVASQIAFGVNSRNFACVNSMA